MDINQLRKLAGLPPLSTKSLFEKYDDEWDQAELEYEEIALYKKIDAIKGQIQEILEQNPSLTLEEIINQIKS